MSFKTEDTGGLTPRVEAIGTFGGRIQIDAVFPAFRFVVLQGEGILPLTTTDARLFAKAIVDACDKIDIEAFVEAGAPLQRSDCE